MEAESQRHTSGSSEFRPEYHRRKKHDSRLSAFADGVRAALPVVLGYLPVGFAYGVLARGQGFTPLHAGAMSILVYAGSAQFIGADMIGRGLAPATIIATTFLVNLRHLLFSASLAPRLKKVGYGLLACIAYGVTDETFSVASATFPEEDGDPVYLIGLNITANLSWLLASVAGAVAGASLGDPARFGADFALPAMFICLLVFNLKSFGAVGAAIISGLLSLFILQSAGSWSTIISAVAGATAGVLVEEWKRTSSI